MSLFVRAGSMYETSDESGITHFLEHVSIRNVNKAMDGGLYALLDREGIEFNASTYYEMIQFYMNGSMGKFRACSDVLSELFSPIILDKAEIDAERKRIKAEIREADDRSSLLAFTNSLVHKGTSLSASITGTLSGVSKISAGRLERYRQRIFTRDNLFVYITGNFSEEDLSYLVSRLEKCNIPRTEEVRDNTAPTSDSHFDRRGEIYVKNSDFTKIRFTFDLDMTRLGVPETDLIYDMLLSGYNSDFFMEMSERRGLFYDVSGAVERYKNIGELSFTYEVREKNLYEAVALTVDALVSLKKNLRSPDTLMKAAYVDNACMLLDDMRELNFTFAYDNHIMGQGYASIEDRRRAYDFVTPEDIRRAACEIFKLRNLTVTVKGNKKRIDTEKIRSIVANLDG
jgi:predicted Zn-dependent peptidase